MCANYHPVTARDRLLQHFGVHRPASEPPSDMAFSLSLAPFIVRSEHRIEMECDLHIGQFGLLPFWAKEMAFGRKTYNVRSETAHEKPSFKEAWAKGRRCVIPAEAIFEPNWETGKAVRWRISRTDGKPMVIAGLWGVWRDKASGNDVLSFTMLTINADEHPLMKRFHRPGEEKRMVVILDETEYDAWLDCPTERMMSFMRPYSADRLEAELAPLRR